MKARLQIRVLLITAGILLLTIGGLATWLSQMVLNPMRTVTLTATGSSVLTEPRALFKSPSLGGAANTPIQVPVLVDSNGGNLATISAKLQYNPLDMTVTLGDTPDSACKAYTARAHDETSGVYTVGCTAPSTGGGQVAPFLTFIVTPRRTGTLPLQLIGRSSDYAVITAR